MMLVVWIVLDMMLVVHVYITMYTLKIYHLKKYVHKTHKCCHVQLSVLVMIYASLGNFFRKVGENFQVGSID